MRFSLILSAFVFILCPSFAYSATLTVPSQYSKIQDAVKAALPGDVVLVDPGTYKENINFLGKAITVMSSSGPDVTIIENTKTWGSVVLFNLKEGPNSIIEGFTITNGTGEDWYPLGGPMGGGVLCFQASPTIRNNIIKDNSAYLGGGIQCIDAASPKILSNMIISNTSSFQSGGGIDCFDQSNPVIKNNIIINNQAVMMGGGIAVWSGCYPSIVHNTICNNQSPAGGGIYSSSSLVLINNIAFDNSVDQLSGGFTKVAFCNIQGGWLGDGNIDQDPIFINTATNDYHLTAYSPCINRTSDTTYTPIDIDNEARPYMGTADIGADEYCGDHLMEADNFKILSSTGGVSNFTLSAGVGNAGRNYILLACISGTNPGVLAPGNLATLPLNPDSLTSTMINYLNSPMFTDFMDVLDPLGDATATFNTMGPIAVSGYTVSFAAALQRPIDFVTNPINIQIK